MAQRNDGKHKVRRGETLAAVAAVSGISVPRLLAANGWTGPHEIARGDVVHIPMPASRAETSGATAPVRRCRRGECPAVATAATPAASADASAAPPPGAALAALRPRRINEVPAPPAALRGAPKEPVSARQTDSAALLPAGAPTGSSDASDYGVGPGDTVIVQAAETLGHFADWTRRRFADAAQL